MLVTYPNEKAWTRYKTYTQAKDYCDMLTMQLAKIPTAEVNSFIESAMEAPHYWIGGKRVGGNWTWGESEYWNSTTWTNWAPTEPNNDRGREDCITIDRDGKWNDQVWSITKFKSV